MATSERENANLNFNFREGQTLSGKAGPWARWREGYFLSLQHEPAEDCWDLACLALPKYPKRIQGRIVDAETVFARSWPTGPHNAIFQFLLFTFQQKNVVTNRQVVGSRSVSSIQTLFFVRE